MKDKPILTASEIGRYHYCSVAWYLQKIGFKPISTHLKPGKRKHQTLGKRIHSVQRQDRISQTLSIIGIVGLSISIILYLFGVL